MVTQVIPVEDVKVGQKILLPNSGTEVTVESVESDEEGYLLWWYRPALRGEPGYGQEVDGRYHGSFRCLPKGHPIRLASR